MFSDIRIGSRLAISFAIVLLLSLVSTAYAIMAARENALATERMMAEPLAKERLMSDWYGNTYAAIARTALIARSNDNTLSSTFAAPISDSVKRTTELIKKLEPLLVSADEVATMKSITAQRATYQAAKDKVMNAKKAGNADEAVKLFNDSFMPAADAYQNTLQSMLTMQRKAIDDIAIVIDRANTRTITLLLVLGTLAVLTGAVCALLITRSITVPLKAAVAVAGTVASGDLTTEFGPASRDEIG
ncbi:HAMP domain-containing protein, partial [Massilia atriviolacea]